MPSKRARVAVAAMLALGAAAGAQTPPDDADKGRKPGASLTVQVVFARFQGDKKVSSMPYTLALNADDARAAVRVGIQVPVFVNLGEGKGTTVSYKDVGNNLDCSAQTLEGGRFKLTFSLEQGSVYSSEVAAKVLSDPSAFQAPVLRNFRSQTNLILRDGQTAQYIAATDPITGELLKIDVTLSVVK